MEERGNPNSRTFGTVEPVARDVDVDALINPEPDPNPTITRAEEQRQQQQTIETQPADNSSNSRPGAFSQAAGIEGDTNVAYRELVRLSRSVFETTEEGVDGPVEDEDGADERGRGLGVFEVDDDFDNGERDSAYGDEVDSITTSIAESVQAYKFEHGRRYHAYQDEKYALPNDDAEMMRLELQHRIWQLSLNSRLNLSPLLTSVRHVLDIGCGTGAWAIEFAETHPHARVIGTDLSPIQPSVVPPNVEFIVDDFTAPWIFDCKFDYIHSRAITIGVKDWELLINEVWRHLNPGGWVEFQEYHAPFVSDDGTIERCPDFGRWNSALLEAASMAGTQLDAILRVPELLEKQGFVGVETASTKWPVGPWAKGRREKRIGDLCLHDVASGLEGLSMRMFTKVLGWSRAEVIELIEKVDVDLHSGKMHAYLPIDFLWAQKPIETMTE